AAVAAPSLGYWHPAVQYGEGDGAPASRVNHADQRSPADVAERAGLADESSPVIEEPLLERPTVDSRHGQDVDEGQASAPQLRVERVQQPDRGSWAHAVGLASAGGVVDHDLVAQLGRQVGTSARLDRTRARDPLRQQLDDVVGIVVEPFEDADEGG